MESKMLVGGMVRGVEYTLFIETTRKARVCLDENNYEIELPRDATNEFCKELGETMVKAILNTKPGTWPAEPIDPCRPCKSQMRRVMKPQPPSFMTDSETGDFLATLETCNTNPLRPRYQVGDRLWVRETWRCMGFDDGDHGFEDDDDGNKILVQYRDETSQWVDFDDVTRWKKFAVCSARWKPSIFMPCEAARLFLEVREAKVERLRDISEIDCLQEGVQGNCVAYGPIDESCDESCMGCHEVNRTAFKKLWNAANGKGAWESNPWGFVYGFMRVGV